MLLFADSLDLVIAKNNGFNDHLANGHLEPCLFIFSDIFVYEDSIHEMI